MNETCRWEADLRIGKSESDRLVFAVAYPANRVDHDGEFTDERELQLAAYSHAGDLEVNIEHAGPDLAAMGAVRVVESYLAPAPFDLNGNVVRKGDWILAFKILADDLWGRIKGPNADLRGCSIEGRAKRTQDGKLVELDVTGVALCRRPCSGLNFLLTKSEKVEPMTEAQRTKILALICSIEQRLELAKREYMAKKNDLEGIMADPNAAADFLKSDFVDDAELSAALDRYCRKFEEVMRAEFGLTKAPNTVMQHDHDPVAFSQQEAQREYLARQRAKQRYENVDECRRDNEQWLKRQGRLG